VNDRIRFFFGMLGLIFAGLLAVQFIRVALGERPSSPPAERPGSPTPPR